MPDICYDSENLYDDIEKYCAGAKHLIKGDFEMYM